MTEQEPAQGSGAAEGQSEADRSTRDRVSEGIKHGIGVLSAFRDALEETINEARERGDLSTDRAKDVMRSALDRAQDAAEGAKERLDLVSQTELAGLAARVDELQARVAALESTPGSGNTQ